MNKSATQRKLKMPFIDAVDLFCGAGGLTYGLNKAGINVRAGVDLDLACRYAYEHNNKAVFIPKSVTDISLDDLNGYFHKNALKFQT